MSYLFIIVIGAIVGFLAGQYLKRSDHGAGLDIAAGGVGACVAVLLSRYVGPTAAAGYVMSPIVAIFGAVLTLFIMRQVIKPKAVPARRVARRF